MKLKGVNRKKFVKSILTIVFIFVLGFMVINSVLASNEAVETKEIEYAVCKGDTLWKIAKKYGSTVDDIVRVNGIENPDKINIGEKIYIPKYVLKRAKEPIVI